MIFKYIAVQYIIFSYSTDDLLHANLLYQFFVCVSFSYKVDVFTNNTSCLQEIGMSTFLASGV